jgi:hypothetical protein
VVPKGNCPYRQLSHRGKCSPQLDRTS